MIISLEDVSYKYNIEPILDHADFVVNEKDKWGVVGLNGSGKSTLLKLMAGKDKPDSGKVVTLNKYKISYCPQNTDFDEELSIKEAVEKATEEKEAYRINSILNKLGFDDYSLKIKTLSGGQKKRVSLAIALIREADLYLLDEPTNHLDQSMIVWLEKYLSKSSKAIVLVTHDRYFLSRITNHIVEIDEGKLYKYEGNYADYLEQKEIRYANIAAREAKRQSFLRTEIEWIRAGAQARTTKQKGRIKRYEEIAAIEAPKVRETLDIKAASSRLGKKTIEIEHLSMSYDDKVLFKDFSYNLLRNDRVGIIGDNGAGKSTLLKIIMGQVKPTSGTVSIGETVKIGYFAQMNEVFKPEQRVIDYLKDFGDIIYTLDGEEITASKMLERFLFFKEDQYKPISKCSGGEKRRLYLCSILMQAPNILLLDEPTNDLDTETLGILEDYLEDFKGAVLTVSHDRYFLDKVCNHLFVFEGETIKLDNRNYSDYLEAKLNESTVKEEVKVNTKVHTTKLSYNEKRLLEELDKKIPVMEENIKVLEGKLNNTSNFEEIRSISDELNKLNNEYEEVLEKWMELSEK
ncbi:MAG: ABC-F family ATP-binding cassette domain-containing protein [Erysipelotrichaceae bacterium]|nr:ABC-F family ATP-binding cassette domain-containing protein [Erysipelotrichaceae bacterium]